MTTQQEDRVIARLETKMDSLVDSVADVRERLVRIETMATNETLADLKNANAQLELRVKELEADRHARVGALRLWDFLHKIAPWLFATGLVVWNWFDARKDLS